jgi:DNA-binding NtrC family response regulator
MKRFVILQDEALVRAELERSLHEWSALPLPTRGATTPAGVAAMPPPPIQAPGGSVPVAMPMSVSAPPSEPVAQAAERLPTRARARQVAGPGARGRTVREREAIAGALDRIPLEPPQGARLLGVSCKTLLNKMKACGITAPPGVGLE